ncbi:hypothetical protein BJX99DRAFT_254061 [Aspergillus californicus]
MSSHATPPKARFLCDDVLLAIFKLLAEEYADLVCLLSDSASKHAAGYIDDERFELADSNLVAVQATLYRIALVSRQFYNNVRHLLYQSIAIYNYKQHDMLLTSVIKRPEVVDRIKSVSVVELPGRRKSESIYRKKKRTFPGAMAFFKGLSGRFNADIPWDEQKKEVRDQALELFVLLQLCPNLKTFHFAPSKQEFKEVFDTLIGTWEAHIPRDRQEYRFLNNVEELTLHSAILRFPFMFSRPHLRSLVLIDTQIGVQWLLELPFTKSPSPSIRELRLLSPKKNIRSLASIISSVERLESVTYDLESARDFTSPCGAHLVRVALDSIQIHSHCLRSLTITIATHDEHLIDWWFARRYFSYEKDFNDFPHLSHLDIPSIFLPCDHPSMIAVLPPNIQGLSILFLFDDATARHMLTMGVELLAQESEHFLALKRVTVRELRKSTLTLDLPVSRMARDFADRDAHFQHEWVE